MRNFPVRLLSLIGIVWLAAACNAYGPKPTPAQSPTPKPTIVPPNEVGSLHSITLDSLGITMLAPSNWKPPVALDSNRVILSREGSTDTSPNAEAFMLIVVGDAKYFQSKMNFREGVSDPVEQLAVLLKIINRDAPEVGKVTAYSTAKYPAALVRSFERSNEMTITLLHVGSDRWVYVGAQSPEKFFPYYEDALFKPAIDSITLKSP
ncbi:MAG: hypothetical protein IT324_12590 [Anaerolineae bacterium]|nr:hypothetical protein [Anaerolineae bacterium]